MLLSLLTALALGRWIRHRFSAVSEGGEKDSQQGLVVSAVLGLLALLTGFTFALAAERFETRRELVLQHANAIGTAYLRVQLLPEPHRQRLSDLIMRYTDNMIALAKVGPVGASPLLAKDDRLLTEIWAASADAYDAIKPLPLAVPFLNAMNAMIDMDGARRAARYAHVPSEVFAGLLVYCVVTAGVLGYVLTDSRGRLVSGLLLLLLVFSLLLIFDIDSPTSGGIRESQGPMEDLRKSIASEPPRVFDRLRRDSARP
jgi:hypothetical protein